MISLNEALTFVNFYVANSGDLTKTLFEVRSERVLAKIEADPTDSEAITEARKYADDEYIDQTVRGSLAGNVERYERFARNNSIEAHYWRHEPREIEGKPNSRYARAIPMAELCEEQARSCIARRDTSTMLLSAFDNGSLKGLIEARKTYQSTHM